MDIFAAQQAEFDGKLVELRRYYEAMPLEERSEFKAWVGELQAVMKKTQWASSLSLQLDEVNEEGEEYPVVEFAPWTILAAIDAWDKGEPLTPNGVLP